MPSRVIGLDVGTHAVRAVELSLGRGPATIQRFGQVALPYGTVVAGEVVDASAVTAALRRLWRETGFKSRDVVVGVANQRVVARTAQVPDMPDAELRSSLQFQVQDLIPIPVEEAVLDYQVTEQITGPDGDPQLRILLVAAHRDMLRSLLAALDGAGLNATRIDLVPFALIRALASTPRSVEEAPRGAEAIVGIGAGVSTIVVHEDGRPRFVRNLVAGGNLVTEQLASELELDIDAAEDLKRRVDSFSPEPEEARAAQIVAGGLDPLIEEIRGSIDFYLAQADGSQLDRLVLTGGGSRLPDLEDRIAQALGVRVERGDPLADVAIGRIGMPEERLRDAADLVAVPLGLALGAEAVEGGVRRLTLLPAELAARQAERRQLALAGLGVAGFAVLLIALFLLRQGQVSDARRDAEQAEDRSAQLRQEIAALQDVETLERDIAARRQTVAGVLEDDIAWTRLLQEVATVMPNDVWLTSFNGAVGEPGTVSFSAMGFDQTSAARWLLRVSELPSLAGLWLPSSTKSESGAGQELVTFSSNAVLTPAARSDRIQRYGETP